MPAFNRLLQHSLALLLPLLLLACSTPPAPVVSQPGHYRVQAGDTLYRIAKAHGRSVAELTRWNRLSDPADIRTGQLLRVTPPDAPVTGKPAPAPRPTASPRPTPSRPAGTPAPTSAPAPQETLQWPAEGALLYRFDGQRNKGIGIAASAGSPVRAAAAGKVVYAGDGIRSYGLLLIIKHDSGLLTTYAHNRKLLVKEGQRVSAGQAIAEAGDSGADRVKVHFEVRQHGQAIDPLRVLPER
ncbi:peptidoglycan DD-metalloendopeptidase family protein [Chitinilyticum litopenaei]|uniref:peptidoglycan DD-metalloendopeptidase family protein n=1 Tax=Chitinilyticum litopenaei TaxID=1121276 RepID=UPI000400F65F|nr:peptidoglycan DD-metalloendopeptidase family protein [Chitinilyticum litopenaei]